MSAVLPIALLLAAPAMGSFFATLACRWPRGAPLVLARSACPTCGHALAWRDLVPLLSWLAARGRCRYCGAGVPLFYPLSELAALALAVAGLALVPGWAGVLTVLLGWALLALALIDLRGLWLPDAITLPLALLGLLVAWQFERPVLEHLVGLAAGFLSLAAVAVLYRRLRGREGLGLGDAKLFAAAGAWLGWQGLPSVLLLAALLSLTAAVLLRLGRGRLPRRLPFGPGLAFAFWCVWVFGPLQFG